MYLQRREPFMTKHSSSKTLYVCIELSQKFKRLNAVTIMSDDEDGLFEQMTTDVIAHIGSLRSDRLVAACSPGARQAEGL